MVIFAIASALYIRIKTPEVDPFPMMHWEFILEVSLKCVAEVLNSFNSLDMRWAGMSC